MGTTKDLQNAEGIQKLKELAEDIKICMFCTELDKSPFETRPMATQEVDNEGVIWFLSDKESHKNHEIKNDDKVQLLYSKMSDSHYLSVYGTATVFRDQKKIDELWDDFAGAWFKKGKEDPNITLITVRPEDVYYWDTKNGKMVSLIKIAVAAITSKTNDDGVEGQIKI
ncbi:MAG: ral stress protein [Bacteroidota bacterium]|jgi:general stress protein 26|nr:ral stress protein [Bacteroidota bacterium]